MNPNPTRQALCIAIPLGIIVNLVIGHPIILFGAPIYLDAIGTILLSLLYGWRVGAVVGVLSSFIGGLIFPHVYYFFCTQFLIAVVTGVSAKHGGFKNVGGVILTGIVMGYLAALVSAPAVTLAFGGDVPFWPTTMENLKNVFITSEVWTEPLDKVLQCLAAWLIYRILSKRNRSSLNA